MPTLFMMLLLALAAPGLQGADLPNTDKSDQEKQGGEPVSYYRQIRPLFQARCQGCHQPAKDEGGYIMTDFAKLLAGGESEEVAIVAHEPDEGSLIRQITVVDGVAEMPRNRDPLAADEIALITRWISEGAVNDTPENAKQRYDMDNPPVYVMPPVITSLDYSPDGTLLAIAGFHEVLLHKADGSGLVARLVGLSERIESGDDLLPSTPRHVMLQRLLDIATPSYLHIPLVLGGDGERLAKSHGATTLRELREDGVDAAEVVSWIAASLGLAAPNERVGVADLVDRFDPATLPREPVVAPPFALRE